MKIPSFLIQITDFLGGFVPHYWDSDYPAYGNDNQAGKMRNVDLSSPHFIQAGPGNTKLTNGDEGGVVSTLIKRILEKAVASDITYAIGGGKLYKISSSAVANDANWPHTLAGTTPVGEDVILYDGDIYYTYNHSTAGEMGKLVTSGPTFDDDFLSTVPATGAFSLTKGAPHPLERGGDDILYIGNGRYVSSYDKSNDIATEQAIDLPLGSVVTDIKWYRKKLIITVNWPDLTGDNQVQQSIFIWNTVDSSWDDEVPQISQGKGMYKKKGVVYIFYKDITSGVSKLGYLNGFQIQELASFSGSLPDFYQIATWKGFIAWVSDGLLYAWGSGERSLPARLFQFMKGEHGTIGGIAAPFGKMMVASTDGGTGYALSKESGYETDAYWYSRLFPISGTAETALIDKYSVSFEKPANSDVKANFKLVDSQGNTLLTKSLEGTTKTKIKEATSIDAEDARVELDFSQGTVTCSLKIKNVFVSGYLKE